MKDLVISTGKHQFLADDFTHLSDGFKEALQMFMKGLLSNGASIPNCILYGMVKTNHLSGDVSFTAGACVLNGEICEFDAQYIVDGTIALPNYGVITGFDTWAAIDPITYGDGTTKNVHRNRKARVEASALPATANQLSWSGTIPQFRTIAATNLGTNTEAWRYIGAVGEIPFLNGFGNGYIDVAADNMRYRKSAGLCHVSGNLNFEPMGSGLTLVCTLPVGYRPDRAIWKDVGVTVPGGHFVARFSVALNGNLTCTPINYSAGLGIGDIASGSPYGASVEFSFPVV